MDKEESKGDEEDSSTDSGEESKVIIMDPEEEEDISEDLEYNLMDDETQEEYMAKMFKNYDEQEEQKRVEREQFRTYDEQMAEEEGAIEQLRLYEEQFVERQERAQKRPTTREPPTYRGPPDDDDDDDGASTNGSDHENPPPDQGPPPDDDQGGPPSDDGSEPGEDSTLQDEMGNLVIRSPDDIVLETTNEFIRVTTSIDHGCHKDKAVAKYNPRSGKLRDLKISECRFFEHIRQLVKNVDSGNANTKHFVGISFNGSLPNYWKPLSFKANVRMMQQVSPGAVEEHKFQHKCRVYEVKTPRTSYLNRYDVNKNRFILNCTSMPTEDEQKEKVVARCEIVEMQDPVRLVDYIHPGFKDVVKDLSDEGETWMKDKYVDLTLTNSLTFVHDNNLMSLAVKIASTKGLCRFKVKDFNVEKRNLLLTLAFDGEFSEYDGYLPPFKIPFAKFHGKSESYDSGEKIFEVKYWTMKMALPQYERAEYMLPNARDDEESRRRLYYFEKGEIKNPVFQIKSNFLNTLSVSLTTEFHEGCRKPAVQSIFFTDQLSTCLEHGDVLNSFVGSFGYNFVPIVEEIDHQRIREFFIRWSKLMMTTFAYECVSMPDRPYTTHIENAIVIFTQRRGTKYPWIKGYLPFQAQKAKRCGIVIPKPGIINKPPKDWRSKLYELKKVDLRQFSLLQLVCLQFTAGGNTPREIVGQRFHFYIYDKKKLPDGGSGMALAKMRLIPIAGQIFPESILNEHSLKKPEEGGKQDALERYKPINNLTQLREVKWAHCNLELINLGEAYRHKMKALLNLNEIILEETKNFIIGKWQIRDENSQPVSQDKQRMLINRFNNRGYFGITLNPAQISAIINCSELPISLIWGPPGTGKTTTLAHQAIYETFMYMAQKHENAAFNDVVVLLAASNEAANNLFEKVCDILDRNEKNEIKVIRVFSSDVEEVEFPYKKGTTKRMDDPGERKRMGNLSPKYTSRWAHHEIREVEQTQEYATYLRTYDETFAKVYGDKQFEKDETFHLKSEYTYKQIRDRAERIVICKAQIIVSTTTSFNYERYNKFQVPNSEQQADQSDRDALDNREDDEDVYDDEDVMKEMMKDVKVMTTEAYKNSKPICVRKVIFDEATMEPETETLVAFQASKRANYTFAGDHRQLGPVVKCQDTKQFGAGVSYFSRYAKQNEEKCAMLTTQYRMNKWIQEYPSTKFYRGNLQVGNPPVQNFLQKDFWRKFYDQQEEVKPVIFINQSGVERLDDTELADRERSYFNDEEIEVAVTLARYLVEKEGVEENQICILTIYSAQQKQLKNELESRGLNYVVAKTVRTAQGKEWDYVLFSCVKSRLYTRETDDHAAERYKGNIGLLGVENDFNVGITRAKHGLIVIGNKKVLSKNKDVLLPWLNEAKQVNWNDYQQDFENYIVP